MEEKLTSTLLTPWRTLLRRRRRRAWPLATELRSELLSAGFDGAELVLEARRGAVAVQAGHEVEVLGAQDDAFGRHGGHEAGDFVEGEDLVVGLGFRRHDGWFGSG